MFWSRHGTFGYELLSIVCQITTQSMVRFFICFYVMLTVMVRQFSGASITLVPKIIAALVKSVLVDTICKYKVIGTIITNILLCITTRHNFFCLALFYVMKYSSKITFTTAANFLLNNLWIFFILQNFILIAFKHHLQIFDFVFMLCDRKSILCIFALLFLKSLRLLDSWYFYVLTCHRLELFS